MRAPLGAKTFHHTTSHLNPNLNPFPITPLHHAKLLLPPPTTLAMPPQRRKGTLEFFKQFPDPATWGLRAYLKAKHGNTTPQQILDGWRKSLVTILQSTGAEFTETQRKRAAVLLERYTQKGAASDRAWGRDWLKAREKRPIPSVQIGALFQGPVEKVSVTQKQDSRRAQDSDSYDEDDEDHDDHSGDDGEGNREDLGGIAVDDASDSEPRDDGPLPEPKGKEPVEECDPVRPYPSLQAIYRAMRIECKWQLRSGRYVEDVIYEACKEMCPKSLADCIAQSFVIDLEDPAMRLWFESEELEEIESLVLPLPPRDELLAESMRRFWHVSSTDELREALQKSYIPHNAEYDRKLHSNCEWADMVFRRLLRLLESRDQPLRSAHLEDWYTSHVWSSVIDDCFLDLDGMTIERKESTCWATKVRKNRERTTASKRNKTSARLDAIIQTVEDNFYEYCAVEVARTFKGLNSTKWIRDMFKVARSMRDMQGRLHDLVKHDRRVVRKLQVVGVTNAGLQFQWVRMNNPKGYICLLKRETLQHFPNDVNKLMDMMNLLMNVAQMKQVIKDCAGIIQERHKKSDEDIFAELMGKESRLTSDVEDNSPVLGWAVDSP